MPPIPAKSSRTRRAGGVWSDDECVEAALGLKTCFFFKSYFVKRSLKKKWWVWGFYASFCWVWVDTEICTFWFQIVNYCHVNNKCMACFGVLTRVFPRVAWLSVIMIYCGMAFLLWYAFFEYGSTVLCCLLLWLWLLLMLSSSSLWWFCFFFSFLLWLLLLLFVMLLLWGNNGRMYCCVNSHDLTGKLKITTAYGHSRCYVTSAFAIFSRAPTKRDPSLKRPL